MDVEEYIASGILELYVAGILSEKENREVDRLAREHPEIQLEIETIERVMLRMTKAASPGMPQIDWARITSEDNDPITFQPDRPKQKTKWINYLGWAAALLFAAGLLWVYVENNRLQSEVQLTNQQKETLEGQILEARETLTTTEAILNDLRAQNVAVITLNGQTAAPDSFAKAYWNAATQSVYIDALGLPEPPPGFTYQVWSLLLDPLTPTSIGLLENFTSNENRLFQLSNPNSSEGFGITLEPEGGSESPTLEQLYTLGAVGP